jgi:ketosteroid isomerase-like protein
VTTTTAEELVRAAYHAAEGDVLDARGFIDLFAEDGVFRDVVNGVTYRGEHLGDPVGYMAHLFPDVHRELHRVHVQGNVVAIELSIRGTFLGTFETPAGVVQPTGGKIDIPTADFWYVEDGKIKEFNCYVGASVMLAQMGVTPDFASAVATTATAN